MATTAPPPIPERLAPDTELNGKAAARYLGWSQQTLANRRYGIKHGTRPAEDAPRVHERRGNENFFLVKDLDEWLATPAGLTAARNVRPYTPAGSLHRIRQQQLAEQQNGGE